MATDTISETTLTRPKRAPGLLSLRTTIGRKRWARDASGRKPIAKLRKELEALREIASLAAYTFEHDGDGLVLKEALRSLSVDLAVLGEATLAHCTELDGLVFLRVRTRISLAIAVSEYRSQFARKGAVSQ